MKKMKIVLTAIVMAAVLLSGCQIGGKEVVITSGVGTEDIFDIGGDSCNLVEAKVYLSNFQNIYGKSYGIDLWKLGFQEAKLKNYIKEITLSEMSKIVCMGLLAKERGISLTEEEKELIAGAAKEYYNTLTKAELDYTGATEEDIAEMYQDYALANKVYQSLTKGVNEEVSDDAARIMEAMQIYVYTKEKADEVAAKLENGEDFAAVASNYNQKPVIELSFGRGEMPLEVENAAFELDNEEISPCIPVENGFYFIKCTNKFNEELTDANKSNIVEAREKAAFDDVYEQFISGLSSNLNETLWDDITLITDGSITTDSFFETIDGAIH